MEDKKLNNQESLELITRMINKTKRQMHKLALVPHLDSGRNRNACRIAQR